MKKHIMKPVLFLLLLSILLSGTGQSVRAADAARGSLGSLSDLSEDKLLKAEKLLGDTDVDEQFEKTFAKAKWSKNFSKTDLKYMACIIYCEARGMGFDAKAAVANAVLNRMYDTDEWKHVNTVKEVIYDTGPAGRWWGYQFSPIKDGSMKKALAVYEKLGTGENRADIEKTMNVCIDVAKEVFKGYKAVPDDFRYFNAHLETQAAACRKNGWSYIILDKHIYYSKETD